METKQVLANLIQMNEQMIKMLRKGYGDKNLKFVLAQQTLGTENRIRSLKKLLKENFDINYDSTKAKSEIIKEGSSVMINSNHTDKMKGSKATVISYSEPAFIADVMMDHLEDKEKMKNHKWLTNSEVELK